MVVANDSSGPIHDNSRRVTTRDGSTLEPEGARPFWEHDPNLSGSAFQPHATAGVLVIRPGKSGGLLIARLLQLDTLISCRFTDDAGLFWQIGQESHCRSLTNVTGKGARP
jgi:hypothetical protein